MVSNLKINLNRHKDVCVCLFYYKLKSHNLRYLIEINCIKGNLRSVSILSTNTMNTIAKENKQNPMDNICLTDLILSSLVLTIFLQLEPFAAAIVVSWQHGGSLANIAWFTIFVDLGSTISLLFNVLLATEGWAEYSTVIFIDSFVFALVVMNVLVVNVWCLCSVCKRPHYKSLKWKRRFLFVNK